MPTKSPNTAEVWEASYTVKLAESTVHSYVNLHSGRSRRSSWLFRTDLFEFDSDDSVDLSDIETTECIAGVAAGMVCPSDNVARDHGYMFHHSKLECTGRGLWIDKVRQRV
jgi:hypothetical protein